MRLAVSAGALALLAVLVVGVSAFAGCPQALLQGVLVREGTVLVIDQGAFPPMHIQWPFGYSVREEHGTLVVKDLFGLLKAHEGDTVHLGGGMVDDPNNVFGVCGDYEVDLAESA